MSNIAAGRGGRLDGGGIESDKMLPSRTAGEPSMQITKKLSITLPKDMAEMMQGMVQPSYAPNGKVIREALLQDQDDLKAQRLVWMREKIDRSLADPGPSIEADDIFARLEDRHRRSADRD
jgi:Arc/MetJ-type ribon-helix-helix transcriptional regulator